MTNETTRVPRRAPSTAFSWREWLIQTVVSAIFAWLVLAPIWRMTFQNGGVTLVPWQVAVCVIFTLLPVWILQGLVLLRVRTLSRLQRFCLYLTSYLGGLGPAVVLAWHLGMKMGHSRLVNGLRTALFLFLILSLFFLFVQLYAILLVSPLTKGVLL